MLEHKCKENRKSGGIQWKRRKRKSHPKKDASKKWNIQRCIA